MTITETLQDLHDHYVVAVNNAVESDDTELARSLAEEFDVAALDAVRQRLAA